MKINHKIFKSLNNPFEVQELEGRQVEVHIMDETPYFATYVNRGQYALWTSDGKNYKLLVEKGYYEEFREIFSPEMNNAWIEYFERLVKSRSRTSKLFWWPTVILIALVVLAVAVAPRLDFIPAVIIDFIETNNKYFLFGGLIFLILMSIINSFVFKRKADRIQIEHATKINDILGAERSHELALQQETYHKRYMAKFEVEEELEELIEEPVAEEAVVAPVVVEEEVIEEPVIEEVVEESVAEEVVEEPVAEEIVEEPIVEEVVEEPVAEEEVEEPVVKEVVEEPVIEEVIKGLEELNLLRADVLREFVKDRRVTGYSTMAKQELISNLPTELEDLRVVELKAVAKEKHIPNFSTMTKPELVYAIRHYVEPVIEEVVEEPIVEEVVDKKPLEELNILTANVLREFVKDRKVSGFSTMNKQQLILALPDELEKLRVVELREIVKAMEISNYSLMTKPELLDVIINGPQEEEEVEEVVEEVIEEPVVEEVVEEPVVEEVVDKEPLDALNILTANTLREFVKDRKISGYSTMNKQQLILALPNELEKLRVVELREIVKAMEISNYSLMTKPELLDVIINGPQEEEEIEEVVEEPVVEEVVVEEPVIEEEADKEPLELLNVLTVDVLREFVKNRNITNYSLMTKPELVSSLPSNLEELTVVELKELVKAHEISNYSVMTKPELIEALTVEPEEEYVEPNIDLSLLTTKELKEFARARKIVNVGLMNKQELVDVLPKVLEQLKVDELKAVAKKLRITNYSIMVKDQLIESIKGQLE